MAAYTFRCSVDFKHSNTSLVLVALLNVHEQSYIDRRCPAMFVFIYVRDPTVKTNCRPLIS